MIYQEQVMAAASRLARLLVRPGRFAPARDGQEGPREDGEGARQLHRGLRARRTRSPEKKANAIFDLLEKFAGYGFNKSHSAAYGLISYQTAYLKANYPVEFMAGLLSNEINNTDKISIFVGECKRMGIPILPPDVNRSRKLKFSARREHGGPSRWRSATGWPRSRMSAQGAMEAAIREREERGDFTSLEDFCRRLDSRIANRKMLESLVKCGAFDFLGRERAELFACIDESLAAATASHRDRASGQVSLFDDLPAPAAKTGARRESSRGPSTRKCRTRRSCSAFMSPDIRSMPMRPLLAAGKYQTIASLNELPDRASFRIGGAIVQVDKKFTKKEGKPFAVVWLEDLTGTLEVVLWNEVYVKVSDALVPGRVIAIQGTLDKRDDTVRAIAQKVKFLTAMTQNGARGNGTADPEGTTIILRFSAAATSAELLDVRQILAASPGAALVQLMFESGNGEIIRMNAGADLRVQPSAELKERLARWLAG